MNENLNLVEILIVCKTGTTLYSPIYGDVELVKVYLRDDNAYPIEIKIGKSSEMIVDFVNDGRLLGNFQGECMLFPSREQRDWSKFKPKKPKFDPKTLKPFDKVLVRDSYLVDWKVQLFSHIIEDEKFYPYVCICNPYKHCIPYNDDTKHLIGTSEEAPEFYRYWED